jgi:hypothetical protein
MSGHVHPTAAVFGRFLTSQATRDEALLVVAHLLKGCRECSVTLSCCAPRVPGRDFPSHVLRRPDVSSAAYSFAVTRFLEQLGDALTRKVQRGELTFDPNGNVLHFDKP